ncbi:MAG: nucleotidyltransferase domain-containing protein [Alphaproteobacteria bacterium]|nr:nucleotidyltransferase domain-containing protein [Alphaproteobacteria bacterium]
MRPSVALELYRTTIKEAAERRGLLNPRVFGSVARGTDREDSDLDILVTPPKGNGLLKMSGFLYELSTKLPVEVHVTSDRNIPIDVRDKILAEAKAI